jgi:O-methyltransferase involved in polyketide biosynthesis
MTTNKQVPLHGVAETLFITLHARAKESSRPDALLRDENAVEMIRKVNYDPSRFKMQAHDEVAVIMRMCVFDRIAREFLERHPEGTIVHIGCGLDTRFERVDNGRVEWYDLDLPEVIALRRELIREQEDRHHLLGGSVFDDFWLKEVRTGLQRPFLFIAEGVFPYFEGMQVKSLFLTIQKYFPGAEVVCDAHTPFILFVDNLQLVFSKVQARLHWGLKHGRDVESWGEGIRMLEEWYYFETDEPRLRSFRWMRHFPLFGKSTGIFHYQLGK